MKWIGALLAITSSWLQAETLTSSEHSFGSNVYIVSEGVDFQIGNNGASDYLFSWTDPDGTNFTNIVDPTLILGTGETYTFTRTSGSHPFAITDETLDISGTDGSFVRVSTSSTDITNATLRPSANFVAQPSGANTVTWTTRNEDLGIYRYTCTVTGHTGMTGVIKIGHGPGDTVQNGAVYRVDEGVTFYLRNSGASHYLFSWSDSSGVYTDVIDPTLVLTYGRQYNFERISGSHPFVITDDTLPVTGTDGSFSRTTTDGTTIDNATLTPIADFTADQFTNSGTLSTDFIGWKPALADQGDYFYTCRVTGHTGMTGAIQITGGPGTTTLVQDNVYRVSEGVAFEVGNSGAADFLFNWTDSSGTYTNIADPTFLFTRGEMYSFVRTSGSHPFAITDDSLPVSGTNGSFVRATSDSGVITAATLTPTEEFTAEPLGSTPGDDESLTIEWTLEPEDIDRYFYTCTVTGHTGMTGAIQVDPNVQTDLGTLTATNFAFQFSAVSGQSYLIQRTSDFINFENVTTFNATQTGTETFLDTEPLTARAFYRVIELD
ncbi:MAG: cupredoxin domain-containing protein [Verrucomicrobiota bacterium]